MSDTNKQPLSEELIEKLITPESMDWIEARTRAFRQSMACYRCAMMEVETKFRVLNEEFSLQYDRNPIETIKTRLKSVTSIQEKLHRLHLPMDVQSMEQNLSDIAGIRVICSFPEDVYLLADALLRQDDITLVQRKDYIAHPKPNGYRSLHLIVEVPIFLEHAKKPMRVEIQLRTIAMDFWASLEHQLKYKKGLDDLEELTEELRRCAEASAALDRRMEQIRQRLEAYVPEEGKRV